MDPPPQCPQCHRSFSDLRYIPKQLNCLHNVCLPCTWIMQVNNNKLCCPVCDHMQRIATGNCDLLPTDVLLCRRLTHNRLTSITKQELQNRVDALWLEIHSWEQQLRGLPEERARVDDVADRAKERIQDAVERVVEEVRARGLQLCRQVDTDMEPYKSVPAARMQTQIKSGVDVCRKAENVIQEFDMGSSEVGASVEDMRLLLEGAENMPTLERVDVYFVDAAVMETIANYGKVTVKGLIRHGTNDINRPTASAPSAPELPLPSAPPMDPPGDWDPAVNGGPPGPGGALCSGMCLPPCYECVMSSSRYADAWTHAQGSPAEAGTASSPAERIPVQIGLAQHAHAGPSLEDEPSSSLVRSAAIPDYAVLSVFNVLSSTWPGPGPGGQSEMKNPQSVVARNQQLVVANTGAGVVQVAELNGRVVCEQRGLFRPRGVAVDCDADRVYVTENFRHVVHAFDYSTLEPRAKYGGDGMFNMPNQVAVDARHKILYVTDNTGVIVMSLVGKGEVIGRLSRIDDVTRGPWGVAVDKHVVVVTYPMDQRVVVYEKSDGVARDPGRALPGHFLEPRGVCIDEAGKMLVADRGGIKILSATSANLISKVTQRLLKPVAVSVSGGMLVAVDESDSRIKVYKATTNA